MPKDALNDVAARKAKPQAKPYKLADGQGMYLLVSETGKYWRLDYRFNAKRKTLAMGCYPDVPLAKARERRDEARQQIADGIDPGAARKAQKQAAGERRANSFEVVAREWHGKHAPIWSSHHGDKIIRLLERDLFPWLGSQPIRDISAPELLTALRRVESRGAFETAHRALQTCGQVFRYAIATGRAERDISADLKGALPPVKPKHHSAITEPNEIGGLLRAIDGYQGSFVMQCALRLAPLVFVRPGELRQAQWAEMDLDAALWAIPAERMKMKESLLVPLATQAVAILQDLHALTGNGPYVFPSPRTDQRPMSNNGVLSALRRMGYDKDEMTGHGFRAMARTVLDEHLNFRPDIIEQQLAHAVKDPNGRAYNRTKHLEERRRMMQVWADWLEECKAGAKVVPFRKKA
ncbi:MAG: integrase arm-type DNA-binding domain-containing protein [Candidatus Contendobacter sp.]|nr:integrase arm-type DNA-binding domain-containing protein [Candidatus Contendobacter sp.]